MVQRAGTITMEKEGERGEGDEKRRQRQQVKYVITPKGQSLSFFLDAEIHLDRPRAAGAADVSTVREMPPMWSLDYQKSETVQHNCVSLEQS